MGAQQDKPPKDSIPLRKSDLDLANWMRNLKESKKTIPITFLAIPGSHDSMTYGINKSSGIAPDADDTLHNLSSFAPNITRAIMRRWAVTQSDDVKKQLFSGIRYLDFRIAPKPMEYGEDKYYFVHGLYAGKVKPGLHEIFNFVKNHPKEIIILDFQHFYSFSDSDHNILHTMLTSIFHNMICPKPTDIPTVTLEWLYENNYNIIIIYRNRFANNIGQYWTSNLWPTQWPDTMDTNYLIDYLRDNLRKRSHDVGLISQCILTPRKETIILQSASNIKKECARPVLDKVVQWLSRSSPPELNVAIADFISLDNCKFPYTIISMNYLL